jgi:enoyl-CoA hydratase
MHYDLPPELTVDKDGPVRIVTLNRPDNLNATNEVLHSALVEVWSQLRADRDARAVILTGAGRAFSAGGDMGMFPSLQEDVDARRQSISEARLIVQNMVDFPLPVVAAVNGAAIGLGASLATMCDIVLMADSAFLSDPHVLVGLVAADGGSVTWPLAIGLLRAKEYLLTGDRITADVALQIGLVNRVVPLADLQSEASALAHRLAAVPARALQDTKRALNLHLKAAVQNVLDFALAAESECFITDEHKDAVASFAKRK